MNTIFFDDDETVEDLQLNGLKIIQKKKGFRFGMDSVLLADFAAIRSTDVVADFGTGSCILPLLLYGRKKGVCFYAFEKQKDIADMAQKTVILNQLDRQINIICDDIIHISSHLSSCSIDAVICNPPYGLPGCTLINPDSSKAEARHQEKDTLNHFLKSAFYVLKGKGKFFIVYPSSQVLSLTEAMKSAHLEPKKLRFVFPRIESQSNLVMIEAVKDAKPSVSIMPPLIVYEKVNCLTNELKSIYHLI